MTVARFHPIDLMSLVRLPLGALFIAVAGQPITATIVLIVAAVSDLADGFVARRWLPERTQGRHSGDWLDPLCDKVFVACAFAGLYLAHRPPAGPIVLALTREWLQVIALLVRAASPALRRRAKEYVYKANWLGKATTVGQFLLLGLLIVGGHVPFAAEPALQWGLAIAVAILGAISVRSYVRRQTHAAAAGTAAVLLGVFLGTSGVAFAADPILDAEAPAPPAAEGLPGAALLPDDGALVVLARPSELEDGFAFADLLGGLYPEMAARLGQLRAPLGLPALGRSDLRAQGLDPERPVLGSLFRPSPGRNATPVLHRFTIPVLDRTRAVAFLAQVANRAQHATATGARDKGAAAGVLKSLGRNATRAGVQLLTVDPIDGTGAMVRTTGTDVLLLDVFTPENKPKNARAAASGVTAVFRKLVDPRQPATGTLTRKLGTSSYRLLERDASLILVGEPAATLPLIPDATCRAGLAPAPLFRDVGIAARLSPFEWRLQFAFAPTDTGAALLGAAGANDGLADPTALASAGLFAAVLYLPSLRGLLESPIPPLMREAGGALEERLSVCGPWAWARAALLHWPAWLARDLGTLAVNLRLGDLLSRARNVAMAMRQLPPAAPDAAMGSRTNAGPAWLTSFEPGVGRELAALITPQAEGPPEAAAFAGRTPNLYNLPPTCSIRTAGIEPLPGDRTGLALSPQPNGLGWYYSQRRRPAVFGNRLALGSVAFNVGRFLRHAAEGGDADTRDAVELATSQIAMINGDLVSDEDLLVLDLKLTAM